MPQIVVENLEKRFRVFAPAAGFLFLAVALAVWGRGIRHYTSTGS